MNGPEILFYIPLFGGLPVTETLVNSWIVMAFLIVLSLWLTHDMKKQHISKKQVVVETGVKMLYQLVGDTMGEDRLYFTPYIGTLFLFTLCANLMGLLTFRSPTARSEYHSSLCNYLLRAGTGILDQGEWSEKPYQRLCGTGAGGTAAQHCG